MCIIKVNIYQELNYFLAHFGDIMHRLDKITSIKNFIPIIRDNSHRKILVYL